MRTLLVAYVSLSCLTAAHARSKPTCAKLSDDFCDSLWSAEHLGNLDGDGFSLRLGDRAKSELPVAEWMNIQSYLAHERDFPADFQRAFAPIAAELRAQTEKETAARSWRRRVRGLMDRIPSAIREASDERAYAKYPGLRTKSRWDLTQIDWNRLEVEFLDLRNELLRIRYENSAEWARVRRVFGEVRTDLLTLSESFPAPIRDLARAKLASMKLSLPYGDPRNINNREECAGHDRNAYYFGTSNALTVCVGRFNTVQDDASTYVTLAHEMSHAFDPNAWTIHRMLERPEGRMLSAFCDARGTPLACDRWEGLKKDLASVPGFAMGTSPYDRIAACLLPKKDLEPFTEAAIDAIAKRYTRRTVSSYAEDNDFTMLVQPTVVKYGRTRPNEYFMDARALRMKNQDDVLWDDCWPLSFMPELFVQIVSCDVGGRAAILGPKKVAAFRSAIEKASDMRGAIFKRIYEGCGRSCSDLDDEGLAFNAGENFADWVSYRLFARRLARLGTPRERRAWATRAEATLCLKPGPLKDAPRFTEAEKEFSLETHADNRVRRLSVFQPQVAEQADCARTPEIDSSGAACDF